MTGRGHNTCPRRRGASEGWVWLRHYASRSSAPPGGGHNTCPPFRGGSPLRHYASRSSAPPLTARLLAGTGIRPRFLALHRRLQSGGGQGFVDAAPVPGPDRLGKAVDDAGGETEGGAHLADGHARTEGDDVGDHAGALGAVALVDVLQHLLAMVGGEVDVDVGGALVVLVEEAFEE